jgi:alpha-beta hydrolase superfamily lysophospholipase
LRFSRPTQRFVSNFSSTLAQQGCDPNGNVAMIVHGWNEGVTTGWANETISKLLQKRGGCVFFMDYSKYAVVSDYFALVSNFKSISAVLVKKLQQIANYDRQFLFGFSFGSRLCIDAGFKIGNKVIARMDLCDPASKFTVITVSCSKQILFRSRL